MTWTYTPDFTDDRDKVRFLVQDTDTNDQLITDEEIAFTLTENSSIYGAAAAICRSIALKLGRELSLLAPAMKWSADEQYRHYIELADTMEAQISSSGGLSLFAGGISIADKNSRVDDTDRVVPSFTTVTLQNPTTANPLTDRTS